jgi:hypothetical protein
MPRKRLRKISAIASIIHPAYWQSETKLGNSEPACLHHANDGWHLKIKDITDCSPRWSTPLGKLSIPRPLGRPEKVTWTARMLIDDDTLKECNLSPDGEQPIWIP